MSQIISYMRELGLTNLERIHDYFFDTDIETIKTFDEYIRDLSFEDWKIAEYSPYLFAPSMDLSGFGGCGEVHCKIDRAIKFNKFSSLYSDAVYFFVESITAPHCLENVEENEFQYRYDLLCDFSLIFSYSHLLEKDIAKIIPPNFCVCPDCFAKHVLDENELKLLNSLVQDYSAKAIVEAAEYDRQSGTGLIVIKNLPELFPDHDGFISITGGEGGEILKAIKTFPSAIKNGVFLQEFIRSLIYEDFYTSKFETFISSAYQSKFITGKRSDKAMIDLLSLGTSAAPAPIFEMPFLENIDVETVLKLRETEYHAFNDYRIALDKATKLYVLGQNPVNSKEIYDDIIYPAFIKLDAMFERTKKMRIFKALGELAIISSTVTLGVMTSAIPANPIGITAALGGTGALVKHLSGVAERKLNSSNELELQDFYFLWQLKNRK